MTHLSFFFLLHLFVQASSQHPWIAQRDNPREYHLSKCVDRVRSIIECSVLASPEHQAIEFVSAPNGTCCMYSCQLGLSGCRKCRNARNSSLPLFLVRALNELPGHTCWQTFQHRVDGSVDFYRNWTDYLSPFGTGEDLNYWMGLEAIHQLTQAGDRRVRWEFSMWNGNWFWVEDTSFALQGAADGYRVTVGDQDTSRSNIMRCSNSHASFMNNNKFSTADNEQDTSGGENCAIKFQGAWWYGSCHCFNPNGRYFTPPTAYNLNGTLWADGLTFSSPGVGYPFDHYYSMITFECLVAANP